MGNVPLNAAVVSGGDQGVPVTAGDPANPAAEAFTEIAGRLVELFPPAADETCTGRIAKLLDDLEIPV
jgi:MinD-like ATPase involved in chromosome partitioning or flagellar assembly